MTDLTAWLLERIAADEAVVAEAGAPLGRVDSELVECDTYAYRYHIAASRVLAECAAHRAIVAEHAPIEVYREQPLVCATCVKVDEGGSYITTDTEDVFPCPTLRALASVYADAPGLREEWL